MLYIRAQDYSESFVCSESLSLDSASFFLDVSCVRSSWVEASEPDAFFPPVHQLPLGAGSTGVVSEVETIADSISESLELSETGF